MTDQKEDLKDYADGWMSERKGTDAPGFLKVAIPIISFGGCAYLVLQMYGDVHHETRGKLVEQFNAATKTSPSLMYIIAAMVFIYAVMVAYFAFSKPHED